MPFETPDSWAWTRFSTLIRIISGVSYDKNDVETKGIRILRGGNINDLRVTPFSDDVYLPETYYDPDKQVQIDDVLIVASTGSKEVIGKAGYVIEPLENTQIGAFLRIVRPLLKLYAPYVKLIFATEYYREHIRHLSGGTNINNIKADYINAFLISLPPYAEQIRIAERINSLFEQIEIIEQNQADTDTLYEEFRKRTLTLAIQGKLVPQNPNDEPASVLLERIRAEKKARLGKKYVDSFIYKGDDNCYYEHITGRAQDEPVEVPFDIPDNWEWSKIKYIADTQTGTTPSTSDKSNFGDHISFVKPGDLVNGRILYNREMLSERGLNSGRLIPSNSVIMVCIGGSAGKCALTDRDISCNQQINTASPCKWVLPQYLFFFMTSDYFYKTVRANATGTATPIINRSAWENLVIPIPPLAEQKRIVAKINEIFAML